VTTIISSPPLADARGSEIRGVFAETYRAVTVRSCEEFCPSALADGGLGLANRRIGPLKHLNGQMVYLIIEW
jgi:hypothetical protein